MPLENHEVVVNSASKATYFSSEHTWAQVDGPYATIGITEHAQDALGPLVYVDLPAVGSNVRRGQSCGIVESTKVASDVIAPLSGRVTEVNREVLNDPTRINVAAEGQGWLFRVEITGNEDLGFLLRQADYAAFLQNS
jgi:glycine cleavage system H protein